MSRKPHVTLKWLLVHSKDKHTPQENLGVVYQVQCKDCQCITTGEMETRHGVREKENKRDVKTLGEKKTPDQGRKTH